MANFTFLFSLMILVAFSATESNAADATSADIDKEYHSLDQMLSEVRLEKMQVEAMVETMVKSGRLSADEGDKARREIASVKEDDIEEIKSQAIVHIKKNDLANK